MEQVLAATVERLLLEAPKPIPATKQRLAQIPDPYVTLKLDGLRTLLVCDGETVHAHTLRGVERIASAPKAAPMGACQVTILDSERIGDYFYVFDALFVKGVDVRHLPTLARLRETKRVLPKCAILKRLYWGPNPSILDTVCRLMRSQPKLADGSRMDSIEGFIFGSLAAPYRQDHLKFKFAITCDFQVKSVCRKSSVGTQSNVRRLGLYVQRMKDIVAFEGNSLAPSVAIVGADLGEQLGLPEGEIGLDSNVILEMKLVARHWEVVRRRYDRLRPNTLRTVQENIELHQSNHSNIHALLSDVSREVADVRCLEHISSAMLRTVGTCGAIAAIEEVHALFLPDHGNLNRELENSVDFSRYVAVVTVLVKNKILLSPTESSHTVALGLDEVVARAKQKGWKCTALCSIRAHDFLVGNCLLPASITRTLENAVFLILRRTDDTSFSAETSKNHSWSTLGRSDTPRELRRNP